MQASFLAEFLPGRARFLTELINAKCENISCCTSVAAVQPPVVRRKGGFLKKRMTTIWPARTATSRSTWESRCTCRATPGWPSTRSAWHAELGAPARGRLHGRPAGRLGQLQLCHRHLERDHKQPARRLRRQPAHSERPGAAPAIS